MIPTPADTDKALVALRKYLESHKHDPFPENMERFAGKTYFEAVEIMANELAVLIDADLGIVHTESKP